jgi:hypothetical protein
MRHFFADDPGRGRRASDLVVDVLHSPITDHPSLISHPPPSLLPNLPS